MEEYFFTGYCRAIDAGRTVTVEPEKGTLIADCAYPTCPFVPTCPIAQQIGNTALL